MSYNSLIAVVDTKDAILMEAQEFSEQNSDPYEGSCDYHDDMTIQEAIVYASEALAEEYIESYSDAHGRYHDVAVPFSDTDGSTKWLLLASCHS